MMDIKFRARWKADLEIVDDILERPISDLNADHLIIEQYTGRKDQYGVEIYDGDIMLYLDQPKDKNLLVKWIDYGWRLLDGEKIFNRRFDKLIVLGNIHDNPELLK